MRVRVGDASQGGQQPAKPKAKPKPKPRPAPSPGVAALASGRPVSSSSGADESSAAYTSGTKTSAASSAASSAAASSKAAEAGASPAAQSFAKPSAPASGGSGAKVPAVFEASSRGPYACVQAAVSAPSAASAGTGGRPRPTPPAGVYLDAGPAPGSSGKRRASPPPAQEPPSLVSPSSPEDEGVNSEDEHQANERGRSTGPAKRGRLSETAFEDALRKQHLVIVSVRPDGNCLFRALAILVYGGEDFHAVVREEVMDFLELHGEWFSQFVAEEFTRYVRRKRRSGCHGNHLELQAAAELYNRPIHVYAYAADPVNIIDCMRDESQAGGGGNDGVSSQNDVEPLRLSFHRGSHYNCILSDPSRVAHTPLAALPPRPRTESASAALARPAARASSSTVEALAASDTTATEEEMERAAMALSLAEARTRSGGTGAGSSSSAAVEALPSSVQALVDMGFSLEMAVDAFHHTETGSAQEVTRYIAQQIMQRKRSSRGSSDSLGSGGAGGGLVGSSQPHGHHFHPRQQTHSEDQPHQRHRQRNHGQPSSKPRHQSRHHQRDQEQRVSRGSEKPSRSLSSSSSSTSSSDSEAASRSTA